MSDTSTTTTLTTKWTSGTAHPPPPRRWPFRISAADGATSSPASPHISRPAAAEPALPVIPKREENHGEETDCSKEKETGPRQRRWVWVLQPMARPGCEAAARACWNRLHQPRLFSSSKAGADADSLCRHRPTSAANSRSRSTHDTTDSHDDSADDTTFADDDEQRGVQASNDTGGLRKKTPPTTDADEVSCEDSGGMLPVIMDVDAAWIALGARVVDPHCAECVEHVATALHKRIPDATDAERTAMARLHLERLQHDGQRYLLDTPLTPEACVGVAPPDADGRPSPSPFECVAAHSILADPFDVLKGGGEPPLEKESDEPLPDSSPVPMLVYARRLYALVCRVALSHFIPVSRLASAPPADSSVLTPLTIWLRAAHRAAQWLEFWGERRYRFITVCEPS